MSIYSAITAHLQWRIETLSNFSLFFWLLIANKVHEVGRELIGGRPLVHTTVFYRWVSILESLSLFH